MRTEIDLVTGAFSYCGAAIAERLLADGRCVRTLTFHPERPHRLRDHVQALPYRFDDAVALTASMEGVNTLYNTYWVRFDKGSATFRSAIENSRKLFAAARDAGVARIVHISITNASLDSTLPYFKGKAQVELALAQSGLPYSIVRPTWVFGGERDVLANNIAWILRHMRVFALPGDGRYPVQPVHVEDLARICRQAAHDGGDRVLDAAGPETMQFGELVRVLRRAVGAPGPTLKLAPRVMAIVARALGLAVHDVVLTPDEIQGLMAGLLISDSAALGSIAFSQWAHENGDSLGRAYANELQRHYSLPGRDASASAVAPRRHEVLPPGPINREISVRELRNHTAAVLEAVRAGERVSLTVNRMPVADIVAHEAQRSPWIPSQRR